MISGGGTGGHIYPALALADALKQVVPGSDFLFVGAQGRMEMERVPQAGYDIVGLPIMGIQRRLTWENLKFPFKLIKSIRRAGRLIQDFKPDAAIGVGGYASWPTLYKAHRVGVPTFIQEQNSYAGMANKQLAKHARRIFVAYPHMEHYFPKEKIMELGNPLRSVLTRMGDPKEAKRSFGLDPDQPVILNIGGSLGAKTLNEAWAAGLEKLQMQGVQLIWQTGKYYYEKYKERGEGKLGVAYRAYLDDMDKAYAAADIIVSRAGALSVSELCMVGKPVIFVPSPNVAEDHQTKNARSIQERGAALLVNDHNAPMDLVDTALDLVKDSSQQASLSAQIAQLAKPHAAENIARVIVNEIEQEKA